LIASENIPEIDFNIGGLRKHALLCVFIKENELNVLDRKVRNWLLHTVCSASRHYTKVRDLIVSHNNASQKQDDGVVLHLLDVSEHLEDCVTAIFRSCMAVQRMSYKNSTCEIFSESHKYKIEKISRMRNQFEHMHSQIISGEVGNGPVSITLSDEGEFIRFRSLKIEALFLYELLKGLYHVVASMFDNFDVSSEIEAIGALKLSITANARVIKK